MNQLNCTPTQLHIDPRYTVSFLDGTLRLAAMIEQGRWAWFDPQTGDWDVDFLQTLGTFATSGECYWALKLVVEEILEEDEDDDS